MLLSLTRFSALLLLAAALASAPDAARAQAAGASGDDFLYKVMAGDTLIGLAQRYTTGTSNWPRLQSLNNVQDTTALPIGKELRIPFAIIPEVPADAIAVHVTGQASANGRQISAQSRVPEGQTVVTGPGGFVTLQLSDGSLLLTTDSSAKVDTGTLNIKNFAIVDEKNVANILGGHPEGVQLLSRGNNLAFRSAKVDFTHRVDRVQINNAVVTGDSIGGSGKGFIYTDSKQYDLVGTVIPMFGINNAFGKLFGPLGGGPAGGLFGITFQVKGPLDKPDFRINPMSALAPGAFRSLFEYRAKEQPRVE